MTDLSELDRASVSNVSGRVIAEEVFERLRSNDEDLELGEIIADICQLPDELKALGARLQELLTPVVSTSADHHPLIEDTVRDSLLNLTDYAAFLTDVEANDPGDAPSESLAHGRYLAQRVLQDGLSRLRSMHSGQ